MTKRLITIIITVLMLLSAASPAFAAELPDYIPQEYYDLADKIAEGARDFKTTVKLGDNGVSTDALATIFMLVLNENPDLFHLVSAYRYTFSEPDVALSILLSYKMTAEDYAAAMETVNSWADKVVSLTDESFTDYEYALFFHDYLATCYDYDTNYGVYDVYGFITSGVGVCQAYTYAYMLLLEKVGIDCSFASSGEMNHIWNVVKVDGEWYHVDVTWDDPLGSVSGKADHGNFLLSDTAMLAQENPHYGWVSPYECSSDKYDDQGTDRADSSYAYLDGKWYYLADKMLWETDSPDTDAGTRIADVVGMKWPVWGSDSAAYTSMYSGILAADGKIYVNSSTGFVEVNPYDGSVRTVLEYQWTNGYFYGFTPYMGEDGVFGAALDTGKVVLHIAKKPGEEERSLIADITSGVVDSSPANGDVNGDGAVNLSDVTRLLQFLAKWDVVIDGTVADVTGDGKINLSDAALIMKRIAGWNV